MASARQSKFAVWNLRGLFWGHVLKTHDWQQVESKSSTWRIELLPEFVFDEECERNIFYGIFDVAWLLMRLRAAC